MSEEKADAMAATVRQLALKAQNVARDLDPSVSLCVSMYTYRYMSVATGLSARGTWRLASLHITALSYHLLTE